MMMDRRTALFSIGGVAAALAAGSVVGTAAYGGNVNSKMERFSQQGGDFGWKPYKLDPEECAKVAYDGYWYKGYGCGYGAFYAFAGLLAEKYGAPYNQFPFTLLETNKGGISDWGTICGALYGAAAAFGLFWGRKERTPMVNELFRWYEITALPIYNPGDAAQGVKGDLPSNEAASVLCHVSVSKWSHKFKIDANSKQRSERCGRITADVAKKACEIYNAKIDSGEKFKGAIAMQKSVSYCGECHGKGKESDITKGVMDCTPCHGGNPHLGDKFKNHP
ncbi:MAG TPA: C-GCAxxG-C-C family protein [Desulfovibrio sp.]|uniref:split-Soret cytochrome c n=1 Tax=Desulfovibrio TaxID=872 RepID=UPI0004244F0D|nr:MULTISPECIES: C-GCAxxG-C-C family protein [Desulfovibrio]MDY0307470.1 C-GCAxxG-C-C family protein [Desulfovibrionaceae bacterium]HMM40036.1 C-GCAxxG-C-C family protein [Desulfovibrio sp.]